MMHRKLSELRKQRGYSQEYVAEQLGVSRQAVSKWERGETLPSTANLMAIAGLFDIGVEELAAHNKKVIVLPDMRALQPMRRATCVALAALMLAAIVCFGIAVYCETRESVARDVVLGFALASAVAMVCAFAVVMARILRYVREDCARRGIRPGFWMLVSTTAVGLLYYLLRRDELTDPQDPA